VRSRILSIEKAPTMIHAPSERGSGLSRIAVLRDVPPERLALIESECSWRDVDAGLRVIGRGDD
jgi:hypothetical protein